MKTNLIFIVLTLLFSSCENDISRTNNLVDNIAGDWLLVSEKQKLNNYAISEDNKGLYVDWGGNIGWVGNIELQKNKTLNINHYWNDNLPSNGRWKVENKTLTLFTELHYVGLIIRDTIQFDVSIDTSDRLVLENDHFLHKYRKL